MIIGYLPYHSILWIGVSILILVLIGGLIGIVHKNIKQIIFAKDFEKTL